MGDDRTIHLVCRRFAYPSVGLLLTVVHSLNGMFTWGENNWRRMQ